MRRRRTGDLSTWTPDELREAGIPYLVNPDDLQSLGIDPMPFFKDIPTGNGFMCGVFLDRTKDADIIAKVDLLNAATTTGHA